MTVDRHRRSVRGAISWWALALGVALGVAAGLIFTWEINPVVERNTAPWQLGTASRDDYVVAVALSYAQNGDLQHAFDRLRALRVRNVWDEAAAVACRRVRSGQTATNADIRVIRALEDLYRSQGASGCADGLYPTPAPISFATPIPGPTATLTLAPPPSKTPTPPLPPPTPVFGSPTATAPAGVRYGVTRVQTFCNPDLPGMIEVRVFDWKGQGVPGVPVTVTWRGNQTDSFFTGLKAERDAGYADFAMTAGHAYTVAIPGLADDPPTVEAVECSVAVDGARVTTTASYWVNFQER